MCCNEVSCRRSASVGLGRTSSLFRWRPWKSEDLRSIDLIRELEGEGSSPEMYFKLVSVSVMLVARHINLAYPMLRKAGTYPAQPYTSES